MVRQIGVAFDPGGTTGYCLFELCPYLPGHLRVLLSGVVLWAGRFDQTLELVRQTTPNGPIVMESFHLYKSKAKDQIGNDFPSVQVIGIVGAWAYMYDRRVAMQPASVMDRVDVLPEHRAALHPGAHASDAYKHAVYWATRAYFRNGPPQ